MCVHDHQLAVLDGQPGWVLLLLDVSILTSDHVYHGFLQLLHIKRTVWVCVRVGMCACVYVCLHMCVCVCVVCVVELHWEDVYKQSPHIIQEHHAYLLRVHRKMILPWFCGSGMPAQVVTAYCVAVSWARHLTAYWSPCSHKM